MKNIPFIFFLLTSLIVFAQSNKEERLQIANAMETSIQHEMLNKWYPQYMDTLYGGFIYFIYLRFQTNRRPG